MNRPRKSPLQSPGVLFLPRILLLLVAGVAAVATCCDALSPLHSTSNANMNANPPATVAVLGATGRLGQETVEALLARGIPVKVLVRPASAEKLRAESSSLFDSPLVEVVEGELLKARPSDTRNFDDDTAAQPSDELVSCLEGCSVCIACYGATRKTRWSDLLRNAEDTDPIHPKQINYRSMMALVRACASTNSNSNSNTIQHIVRITGKGEDPNGLFSVLLNGLGSFCKLWNYQGETVLRNALKTGAIGYTIVRPGVMTEALKPIKNNDNNEQRRDLELADNGGNDLPVTSVAYKEIAELLAELADGVGDGRIGQTHNNQRVTLAAMNVVKNTNSTPTTIRERIAALTNDSREFPASLEAEHKEAVRRGFRKVTVGVTSVVGLGLGAVVARLL